MEQRLGKQKFSDCTHEGKDYPNGFEKCDEESCQKCEDGKWVDTEK